MQTFSFKAAQLRPPTTVEVDRRWLRIATPAGQAHMDFHSLEALHYATQRVRGVTTASLYLQQKGKRKATVLATTSFAAPNNFEEHQRMVSTILAAVGEARPDLHVVMRAPLSASILQMGITVTACAAVIGINIAIDRERDPQTLIVAACIFVFATIYLLFHFGLLGKKKAPVAAADLARQIASQTA